MKMGLQEPVVPHQNSSHPIPSQTIRAIPFRPAKATTDDEHFVNPVFMRNYVFFALVSQAVSFWPSRDGWRTDLGIGFQSPSPSPSLSPSPSEFQSDSRLRDVVRLLPLWALVLYGPRQANPPHFARPALLHPCPRSWSFYFAFSLFFFPQLVLCCCHRATMLWPPFLGLAVSSAFVAPCSRLLSPVPFQHFPSLPFHPKSNPQSFHGKALLGSRLRQLSLDRLSFCLSDPPLASQSLALTLLRATGLILLYPPSAVLSHLLFTAA